MFSTFSGHQNGEVLVFTTRVRAARRAPRESLGPISARIYRKLDCPGPRYARHAWTCMDVHGRIQSSMEVQVTAFQNTWLRKLTNGGKEQFTNEKPDRRTNAHESPGNYPGKGVETKLAKNLEDVFRRISVRPTSIPKFSIRPFEMFCPSVSPSIYPNILPMGFRAKVGSV